jgi:hypothetical protein
MIKENPNYKRLFKRENKSLRSELNWKDKVSFESVSDEVFFIHPEYIADYEKIRTETGALIIASGKDINFIRRMNEKRGYVCIVPEKDRIGSLDSAYQDSWDESLQTCELYPINSLIISDNYLFSRISTRKESGLFALLKSIIPLQLRVPFHLAIFSLLGGNYTFSEEDANSLIEEIKGLFPNVEMKVTIVVHTKKSTTHDREIVSNYHRITSGAGYSVIEDEDGIKEVAKGFIEPVFYSITTTPEGHMCVKHFHYQTIEWLKQIYCRKLGSGGGSYIVGDKGHRLLDEK